jgi:hypothetical protein
MIASIAAMWMGCCVHAGVVYSNDFNGGEYAAPGISTLYHNAAEIGGQLVPTNGAVSGMLIDISALDLLNNDSVAAVKITAVAYRESDWHTLGFATQTGWQHPDTAGGLGWSPYFWMPEGQLRSGRGHFDGGTEWDAPGDTPAGLPMTVEMTFYKNTSSTNDDTASVMITIPGIATNTVFDQQVLEYGTTGSATLNGVQLCFGSGTGQYFDDVVVETIFKPSGVIYSNDFDGNEVAAAGVSTLFQNAGEVGGQLVPTNGAVSGMLIDLSALDLINDENIEGVKVTAVAYRESDWHTLGFATQTDWWHPDTVDGKGWSPYFWMPEGQLRSGRGHFSGGTEWDAPGDTPAGLPMTVEMTFYKNTSSTTDDTASVMITIPGIATNTVFDQQVLEYGTNGTANLNGVQLCFGSGTGQYFDDVVVEVFGTLVVPPFPAYPDLLGPNLIENGDFTTLSNQTTASGNWDVAGSNGDSIYGDGTAELVGWAHYYADPDGLVPAVGTPQVIDGNGELDGTYYLDTHINGSTVVMNSSMNYRNGMKQEDILNGATINPASDYLMVVKAERVTGGGQSFSNGTFTCALTVGSGTDVTNTATAVAGSLHVVSFTNLPPGGQPVNDIISGADLSAAGPVNMIFDQVNTDIIPGFPGSVAPGDVNNIDLVSQARVYSVSLAEKLTPAVGDLNKDGALNTADVDTAYATLDGSIDGGPDAATRQALVIAEGNTPAEALAYLNLTEFDLNGDDTFDAADIAILEAMFIPVIQSAVMNGSGHFSVEVSGLMDGATYYLMKKTDLTAPTFDVVADTVTAGANTETMTDTNTVSEQAFYRVTD